MLLDTTPLTSDGEDVVSFSRDMNADESTAPPAERVTNFFIADILSPNFGRKRCTKCAALPDVRIPRVGEWAERTPWKVHTYLGTSDIQLGLQTGTLPGNEDAVKEQSEWPAWVYCTRYSDRPTAGELLFTFSVSFHISPFLPDIYHKWLFGNPHKHIYICKHVHGCQ